MKYFFPEELAKGVLCASERLRIRRAEERDLDYIMSLEFAPENLKFIVPFERDVHLNIIQKGEASMDIIVETLDGHPVGYVLAAGLTTEAKEMEWTHVIIGEKGKGYGHEAMKLLKYWAFKKLGFHRAWLDCKDYNARALHLYTAEGMVREGLIRETIVTNGVYEDLVILGILQREFLAREREGLELSIEEEG